MTLKISACRRASIVNCSKLFVNINQGEPAQKRRKKPSICICSRLSKLSTWFRNKDRFFDLL